MKRHDFTQYFEYAKRNNDDTLFVRCTENVPEILSDFMREVHLECYDCWPNDWIYGIIWQAFEELEENDIEDITIEADCYYHELNKWFVEPFAYLFVEEGIEEGLSDTKDIYKMIECGQWLAKNRIYRLVNEFINDNEKVKGNE